MLSFAVIRLYPVLFYSVIKTYKIYITIIYVFVPIYTHLYIDYIIFLEVLMNTNGFLNIYLYIYIYGFIIVIVVGRRYL